jgi:hypothetical protein
VCFSQLSQFFSEGFYALALLGFSRRLLLRIEKARKTRDFLALLCRWQHGRTPGSPEASARSDGALAYSGGHVVWRTRGCTFVAGCHAAESSSRIMYTSTHYLLAQKQALSQFGW